MITPYLIIKCVGFVCYSNALIARRSDREYQGCLLSLIGSPSHVKAMSALIYSGEVVCRVSDDNDESADLLFSGSIRTCRTRKIGEVVNKVLVATGFNESSLHATVFGPDLPSVQERAFRRVDKATTIPLKPQWQEWLWEKMISPEKLFSFGDENFQEAYLVNIPCDETLESRVLEAIKSGEIQ
ncbi:MAG: hypothetical protein OEL83_20885 [Desulforhopalus sp.]|nr:hypothetical protein [Desulforhopalus sp.]